MTIATMRLFLSLLMILDVRSAVGEEAFATWSWWIPFLVSVILLAVSVWMRLSTNESPAFIKIKAQSKIFNAPLTETSVK